MDVLRRRAAKPPAHKDHGPFLDDGLDGAFYEMEPLRVLVGPLAGDIIGAALKEKGVAASNTEYLKQVAQAFDEACNVFVELNLDSNAEMAQTNARSFSSSWRTEPESPPIPPIFSLYPLTR